MDEIKGIARVKIHPGKLDEWKRLTEQAMEIVRTRDRGTLQYEVFFNDDESEAIVFERYQDADAALEHFANIGHLMERLMATATVTARSSAPRARRCEHSLATANRNCSPRGWPHTTRRHHAAPASPVEEHGRDQSPSLPSNAGYALELGVVRPPVRRVWPRCGLCTPSVTIAG